MFNLNDTIVAIATPPGEGAIGMIRLSGSDAIGIANKIFSGKDLTEQATHTIHFGKIMDGDTVVDEAVASIYIAPKSYTGEKHSRAELPRKRLHIAAGNEPVHEAWGTYG